jgi:hypothetical protein
MGVGLTKLRLKLLDAVRGRKPAAVGAGDSPPAAAPKVVGR